MKRLRYIWVVVGLLWIVVLLNYVDRQAIFSVFPLIRKDLGLSDFQLGLLSTAFLWIYGLASPFAGYLGDRWGRRPTILFSLFVWSTATWATGHSHSYYSMLGVRAAMGISEACYLPAALALIADLHRERSISFATAVHQSGIYAGIIIGGAGGGWLGEHYGWRNTFTLLGIVGIGYALILIPALRHSSPPLRTADRNKSLSMTAAARKLVVTRGFLPIVFTFSAFSIANWAIYTWLPVYLYERFKMSLTHAGFSATFYLQIASVLGILTGGWISDLWSQRRQRARLLVQVIGLVFAAPCLFIAGATASLFTLIFSLVIFGAAKGFYDANTMPVLFQLVPGGLRSTGYGFMNFAGCLAGGLAAGAAGALKNTLGLGAIFSIIAFLLLGAAALLYRVPLQTVQLQHAEDVIA